MTTSRARTWAQGVAALAALTVVIAGVPMWLHAVAGSPIPDSIPDWDQAWTSLTSRDDGTLLLSLLKYAAWAGWALFVSSVIADVVTRLRGLPAPRLGPQQQLASQLISAVVALAVSVPTTMAASAAPIPPTSASQGAAAIPAAGWVAGSPMHATASSEAADPQPHYDEYTVRRGDCLWDIAWNELGEPARWPEIYEASRSVTQPEGRRLTDPDLILTGWVLHIPVPKAAADGDASADPSPASDVPSESLPTPERSNVVTPLFGPASGSPQADGHMDAQRVDWQPVATALNTPRPSTTVSAVEDRWIHALAEHDRSAGSRSRLAQPPRQQGLPTRPPLIRSNLPQIVPQDARRSRTQASGSLHFPQLRPRPASPDAIPLGRRSRHGTSVLSAPCPTTSTNS